MMATPACMSDDGNPAVFVGTMLQTGDAVALCDECMVPWAAALLQVMTGVDPTPFLQAVSGSEITVDEVAAAEHAADQGVPAGEGPPRPAGGRRGRTSGASRGAGTDGDHGDGTKPTRTSNSTPAA